MKWSIFPVAVFATLLAATSYAGGLLIDGDEGYTTYVPTTQYEAASVQPVTYTPGYGYAGAYDPFGPQIYSPWNSSRCYNCMGVWAGYGCHEFKGPGKGACGGGGKFGGKGCQHGCSNSAGVCTAGGCSAANATIESAHADVAPAVEPVDPPMPSEEKSASRTTVWPQASALFPVLSN